MHEPSLEIDTEPAPDQMTQENTAAENGSQISYRNILGSLALSLIVLGVIGYFTFEPDMFQRVLNVNPWILTLAALSVVLRVFFGTWRLNYVSHGRLSWLGALRGQLAWDFFSNVTPSTIGGGPIASAYIARDQQLPLGEATSIMLFSMLLDQIWFALTIPAILILGLHMEIIPQSLGTVGIWSFTLYFLMFMMWVLTFGYATLVRPLLLEKLVNRMCRIKGLSRFRERALNVVNELQHRARILRTQPPRFYFNGFVLTLAVWVCRYVLVVFIIWSFYPALDKLLVFLRTAALTIGSVVLPTPGGAGGLEGLYAIMLGPLMPDGLVAPTLLVWRLMGYYLFIALGVYLSVHQVQQTIRRKKSGPAPVTHSGNGTASDEPVIHTSETVEP